MNTNAAITMPAPWPAMPAGSAGRLPLLRRRKNALVRPAVDIRPFKSFFSTASGFGTIELDNHSVKIELIEGELPVEKLALTDGAQTQSFDWKATVQAGASAIKNI